MEFKSSRAPSRKKKNAKKVEEAAPRPHQLSARPIGLDRAILQAKLSVGPAGDRFESEADAVADRVVRRIHGTSTETSTLEQSQPSAARIQPIRRRSEVGAEGGTIDSELEQAIQASRGRGRPLSKDIRRKIEPEFGQSFENVNMHTGSSASELCDRIQAKAFAVGNDVYLRDGSPDVSTRSGTHLLAHELTHVVQQGPSHVQRSLAAPGQRIQRDTKKPLPKKPLPKKPGKKGPPNKPLPPEPVNDGPPNKPLPAAPQQRGWARGEARGEADESSKFLNAKGTRGKEGDGAKERERVQNHRDAAGKSFFKFIEALMGYPSHAKLTSALSSYFNSGVASLRLSGDDDVANGLAGLQKKIGALKPVSGGRSLGAAGNQWSKKEHAHSKQGKEAAEEGGAKWAKAIQKMKELGTVADEAKVSYTQEIAKNKVSVRATFGPLMEHQADWSAMVDLTPNFAPGAFGSMLTNVTNALLDPRLAEFEEGARFFSKQEKKRQKEQAAVDVARTRAAYATN